jgi:hypothetical protein
MTRRKSKRYDTHLLRKGDSKTAAKKFNKKRCKTKRTYRTREEAWLVASSFSESKHSFIDLKPYHCPHCKKYHVKKRKIEA